MNTLDLILEVGTEEIPAGYMEPALSAMSERMTKMLGDQNLGFDRIKTWATPRRLAVGVWGVPESQPDVVKEVTGPPAKAAFDAEGRPTKAAEGFAKGQGVDVSEIVAVETPKGPYVAIRKDVKGRPAVDVLAEMLPPLILGLPFPKSMRWGKGEVLFVRPVHWLLAVLGGRVLPMAIGDIQAGSVSHGHRFHHPGPVEILSPDDYETRLADVRVIASAEGRMNRVREEMHRVVAESGQDIRIIPDEDLVAEVANLVEYPVAVLGRFDDVYLELPSDIPVTAMREHQRYFAAADADGKLLPYFIALNNTEARDLDVVRKGHGRVLRARLEDARFYFVEDRKTPLAAGKEKLKAVVFHALLGTSWEKVERFRALAEQLAGMIGLGDADKAHLRRAAELCKCDLVTGVVGQFPDLQGAMGREYALLDGEPEAVAQAIYEHYLPNRAGGDLPESEIGSILSMADKIDTIAGCFGVGLLPTGAADPFALRRQALGVINIILDRPYRLSLGALVDMALEGLIDRIKRPASEIKADVVEFFRLRLKNQMTGQGASTDGAEAVLSLHYDDMVAAHARVWALEEIKKRPDFNDLAVAFKRVVNIIKKFGAQGAFDPDKSVEPQEKRLFEEAEAVAVEAAGLMASDDFSGLINRIVSLKPVVDEFFDRVLVDDPNPEIKANRLALLSRVSGLFDLVGDFSKISTR